MLGDFGSYWDVDLTPVLTILGEGFDNKQGKLRHLRSKHILSYIYFVIDLNF